MIERTGGGLVADRCPQRLAPDRPPKAHVPHQPGHRTARDGEALPPQLPPDLAHAIDAEVLLEDASDLDFQIRVAADPLGQAGGIGALAGVGMVGRRGDRPEPADRAELIAIFTAI